jgi:hypothetical protein
VSKRKTTAKIAVGTIGGLRSAVLDFVADKADVFVSSRSFGSYAKVSFHESGEGHWARTGEWARRFDMPNQSRFDERWNEPRPQGTAAACVLRIFVPRDELLIVSPEATDLESVYFLAAPEYGHALILGCYLTPPIPSGNSFDAPEGTICQLKLADERCFLVTHNVQRESFDLQTMRETVYAEVERMCLPVKPKPTDRLTLFAPGDTRDMMDISVAPQGAEIVSP